MGPLAIGYVLHEEHDVVTNYFFPGEEHEIDPWISHWKAIQGTLFAEVFYPRTAAIDGISEGMVENFGDVERSVASVLSRAAVSKPIRTAATVRVLPQEQVDALQFLSDFSDKMRKTAALSDDDPERRARVYWSTTEPPHLWLTELRVSFTHESLIALEKAGYVEGNPHLGIRYRITEAGRTALAEVKSLRG